MSFEAVKSFLEIIAWIAYVIGGLGFYLINSYALTNMLISLVWWIPLLFIVIKEDDRKIIAEMLMHWAGKPVSEERHKKILEDIEKDLKKTKQF